MEEKRTTAEVVARSGVEIWAITSNVYLPKIGFDAVRRWRRVGENEWEERDEPWLVLKGKHGIRGEVR
jgi:hypothetical protein